MTVPALPGASIARKLTGIGLLTTGLALVALSVVLIIRGALDGRARIVADLETSAAIIGANAAPAVMFDDARAVADTLAALAAKPSITYGAFYDRTGKRFAEFRPPGADGGAPLPPPAQGHTFTPTHVSLSRPIAFQGEAMGSIHLRADLREMYGKLARDTALIILTALAAFGAGTALLYRLQRRIVQPIRGLASAMQGVTEGQNYGVRVPVRSRDEIGVLAQSFNAMLERIQGRDAELARHRDRLEADVAHRTAELQQANARLELELLERQRAENSLKRYTQQIDLLSRMATTLQSCLEPQEVGPVVSRHMAQLFPRWSGGIYLIRASKNLAEAATTWGSAPPKAPVFAPNDCWASRRGQLHQFESAAPAPRCAHADNGPDCQMCAPLTAQGEMLGVLHVQGSHLQDADAGLIERIAGEAAQALSNLRYREALKHMAIRDPLTGLYNRRYLEEYLEMETARAARKGAALGVVFIDIDRFKRFNDSYGHEAGDALLREISKLLTRHIREGDAACRYGGEEFVVAMWECELDAVRQRAERLREDAKALQLEVGAQTMASVTLSAGVAVYPRHGGTAEAVLRAADRALYAAKAAGRDRVCVAATG